ncbi:hypothetical protein [Aquimarina rhabdastrellae]
MSSIKERILYFIEEKGISKYRFYENTGITRGVLDKKSGITEDNILKFIEYYNEVSLEWLILGKGEMYKSSILKEDKATQNTEVQPKDTELKNTIIDLLTHDEDIRTAFSLFVGKEMNTFLSQKLLELIQDETFFEMFRTYLKQRKKGDH